VTGSEFFLTFLAAVFQGPTGPGDLWKALETSSVTLRYAASGGDSACSMEFRGLKRTYRLHRPAAGGSPLPLVIVLHGGGGTGEGMIKLTGGGFDRLADRDRFLAVYPDGVGKNWNDGRSPEETRYRTHTENIDDVGFISALIDSLVRKQNADPHSVYVTGISNGGMMSYRLACEIPEKIAAAAPVAGSIPRNLFGRCSPSRPVSILAINNIDDRLMPWDGGSVTGPFGVNKLGAVLSVSEVIGFWVDEDACSPTPVVTDEPDRDPEDGTRVRREEYGGGTDGTEVILYAVEGGGHTWPGGSQYLPAWIIGRTSRDIDATTLIWDFFKGHIRK